MNDPRKLVLFGAICLLVGMFGVTIIRDWPRLSGKQTQEAVVVQPTTVPTPSAYADWKLFRNGYAFPLPPEWKNTSDKGGTAVLEPGSKVGGIAKITATVLSDAKAPQSQQFTTQREFDEWSAVSGEVQGPIQKLKTVMVDNQNAVVLMDTTDGEKNWKVIVWVRKDERNLYLTFFGNEVYGAADTAAIEYIASQFLFTAPASSGKEGKE